MNKASFNWATPVKAWKSPSMPQPVEPSFELQLGHAGEGVEIRNCCFYGQRVAVASIGPRR